MSDLIALLDEERQRPLKIPGIRHEVFAQGVRYIDLNGNGSMIVYTDLNAANADQVIAEQIAYFRQLGQDFEWKLYSHDQPADLKDRLIAHGFEVEEVEAVVVLDLTQPAPVLERPAPQNVQRITTHAEIHRAMAVQHAVWDEDFTHLADELAEEMEADPTAISIYAVYEEGEPVCSAWIRYQMGSPFASLWGGSTLTDYRGRGFYTSLVSVRAHEAHARGYRYLSVEASLMSRPVLEKLGFRFVTETYPCQWHFPAT